MQPAEQSWRLQSGIEWVQDAKKAQQLVNEMQQGKIAGKDPSLAQLTELRSICGNLQVWLNEIEHK